MNDEIRRVDERGRDEVREEDLLEGECIIYKSVRDKPALLEDEMPCSLVCGTSGASDATSIEPQSFLLSVLR